MSVSLIAPALPAIAQALDISREQAGLLVISYTFPGIFLAIFLGILADKYGRKTILVPSLFLYGLAGGACFFVRDFTLLLILRFIQGVGGAGLTSLSTVLIGDLYDGNQRDRAMGANTTVLSVGVGSFPLVGGMMALVNWNVPFLFFFLALGVGIMVWGVLESPQPVQNEHLGAYLRGSFQYVRKLRAIVALTIWTFVFVILYGCILTYFAFLLAQYFQANPFTIGCFAASIQFSTALISSQLGRLSQKFFRWNIVTVAFIFYSISLFLIPYMRTIPGMLVCTLLYGIGQGLCLPMLSSIATGLAPAEYRGIMVTLFGTCVRVGQTIGPPIMAGILYLADLKGVFLFSSLISILIFCILLACGPAFRRIEGENVTRE